MKSKSRTTKHNKLTVIGNHYHLLQLTIIADVRISKRDKWYLIKNLSDDITEAKLPSNKQVLQYFFNLHRIQNKPVRTAAGKVVKKLSTFWAKANVPVRHKPDCINQVQKLFKR